MSLFLYFLFCSHILIISCFSFSTAVFQGNGTLESGLVVAEDGFYLVHAILHLDCFAD